MSYPSSKAGYLKESKDIGEILQNVGQKGSDFFSNPMVERAFGVVGHVVGEAIPIPIVGGMIGKHQGKDLAHGLSYASGLVGEVGKSIQDLQNGGSVGQEIKDVLNYVPKRYWEDFKNDTINSDVAKVIRGDMNWRDAVVNALEQEAMIDIIAPGKTHAWKDKQGNYHKEYVKGAKMVVGEWKQPSTPQAHHPDLSGNSGNSEILGFRNGQAYYKGLDDAAWAAIQANKK